MGRGRCSEWIQFSYVVDIDKDGDKERALVWAIVLNKKGKQPFLRVNTWPWFETAFGWVYKAYESKFWYWEMLEFLRKFMLSSAIIFCAPGTSTQIIVGLVISLIFLFVLTTFKPYEHDSDDTVQSLCFFSLNVTLISGIALRVQEFEALDSNQTLVISGIILGMNGLLALSGLGIFYVEGCMPAMEMCSKKCCGGSPPVSPEEGALGAAMVGGAALGTGAAYASNSSSSSDSSDMEELRSFSDDSDSD